MNQLSPDQFQQIINLVYVLVMAVVALGTVGLGAAILTLRQHKDMLRMVYASASPETQQLIREIAQGVKQAADLAVDVIDAPAVVTTTTTTSATGTVAAPFVGEAPHDAKVAVAPGRAATPAVG